VVRAVRGDARLLGVPLRLPGARGEAQETEIHPYKTTGQHISRVVCLMI